MNRMNTVKAALYSWGLTLLPLSPAHTADIRYETLIKRICFDHLYDRKQNAAYLQKRGWKRLKPYWQHRTPLAPQGIWKSNFRPKQGYFLEKPDHSAMFLFGQADNDLYPNVKCEFRTSDHKIAIKRIQRRISSIFAPHKAKIISGRTGISHSSWDIGTYKRNISATVPFNNAGTARYPANFRASKTVFSLYVVGMIRK